MTALPLSAVADDLLLTLFWFCAGLASGGIVIVLIGMVRLRRRIRRHERHQEQWIALTQRRRQQLELLAQQRADRDQ